MICNDLSNLLLKMNKYLPQVKNNSYGISWIIIALLFISLFYFLHPNEIVTLIFMELFFLNVLYGLQRKESIKRILLKHDMFLCSSYLFFSFISIFFLLFFGFKIFRIFFNS